MNPPARLSETEARELARCAFRRAGVADAQADAAAEILVLAEMMGIATHGLSRVGDYVRRLSDGSLDAQARPRLQSLGSALARVEGADAIGPAGLRMALDAAIDMARDGGAGVVVVANGGHAGALAPYLWLGCEAGCACIVTSNTAPMLAPAGGRAARVGNSPLGIGLPDPDGRHMMLDMAMSVVARSRLRDAARSDRPIPDDWATDAEGRPTRDPNAALQGMLRAIGGDKGATLALALDLLAGLLPGSAILSEIAAPTDRRPQRLGQMVIAIDAARLADPGMQAGRLADARRILDETPARKATLPPRLPGARAVAALTEARREGIAVSADLLAELRALAGGAA